MKKLVISGLFLGALTLQAAVITVQDGGIVLNSTNTATVGSSGDPWLIDENMTAPGTLKFAGTQAPTGALGVPPLAPGNPTGSGHNEGKWISKTVWNDTGVPWTSFELELQVILGVASGEGDGLSFADGSTVKDNFTSDKFLGYTRIDTTRDYLNFNGGLVEDGESVTFNFVISDNRANDPFYLLQTPNRSDVPEPSSMALLGAGLAGVAFLRRRWAR